MFTAVIILAADLLYCMAKQLKSVKSIKQVIDRNGFQIRVQQINIVKNPVFFDCLVLGVAVSLYIIGPHLKKKHHEIEIIPLGNEHPFMKNSHSFFVLVQ